MWTDNELGFNIFSSRRLLSINDQQSKGQEGTHFYTVGVPWHFPNRDVILRALTPEKKIGVKAIPICALFIKTFQKTLYSNMNLDEKEN